MDAQLIELQTLRDLREIDNSIRELQINSARVNKRFKRGIKILEAEKQSVENELNNGAATIAGSSCRETRSQELINLIADPQIENIPPDTTV